MSKSSRSNLTKSFTPTFANSHSSSMHLCSIAMFTAGASQSAVVRACPCLISSWTHQTRAWIFLIWTVPRSMWPSAAVWLAKHFTILVTSALLSSTKRSSKEVKPSFWTMQAWVASAVMLQMAKTACRSGTGAGGAGTAGGTGGIAAICKQNPPDVSKHCMCHCAWSMHTSFCVVATVCCRQLALVRWSASCRSNHSLGTPPETVLATPWPSQHPLHSVRNLSTAALFHHVQHADTQWWSTICIWTNCPICSMCTIAQPSPFSNRFSTLQHSRSALGLTNWMNHDVLTLLHDNKTMTSMPSCHKCEPKKDCVCQNYFCQGLICSMHMEHSNHAWCLCHIPICSQWRKSHEKQLKKTIQNAVSCCAQCQNGFKWSNKRWWFNQQDHLQLHKSQKVWKKDGCHQKHTKMCTKPVKKTAMTGKYSCVWKSTHRPTNDRLQSTAWWQKSRMNQLYLTTRMCMRSL